MKKTLLLTATFLLALLSLIACKDKKVESSEHFGYTFDYVKENFNAPDGFELSYESEQSLAYTDSSSSSGWTSIWFSKLEHDTYVDNIQIRSTSQEDLKQYFELVDDLLDITANSQEVSDILALIDSDEMTTITLSDGSMVSSGKLEDVCDLVFNKVKK